MARNVNDILFRFLADTKSLNRGTKDAKKQLGGVSKGMSGVTKAAGAMAVAFAAAKVGDFASDAIQLAISADEVDEKFRAVFGSATDLNDSLREWGDLAGVTEQTGKDLAATFGNLAMAQGISREETEELTLLVAELAGDMASFNDSDPEGVFFDLNKALLTTEREGMKKYGIALTETEIKQRALDIAVADGRTEFTKADKALASYQLAVEQAGKAVGDLERTSDSTANQQRQLKATFEELQEEIGRDLLPVYADLLKITKDLTPVISKAARSFGDLAGDISLVTGSLVDLGGDEGKGNVDRVSDAFAGFLGVFSNVMGTFVPGIDEMQGAFDRLGETAVTGLGNTADVLASRYNPMMSTMATVTEDAAEALTGVVRGLNNFGDINLNDAILGYFKTLNGLILSIEEKIALSRSSGTGGAPGGGKTIGFLHQGGSIQPGGSAVVGEKGPELISPRGGAQITPSHRSGGGGGGGPSITVNFNGIVGDPTEVAEQIQDLLEQYTRTNVSF